MKQETYKLDALEFLGKIPDNSVNLILTDPPYLTTDISIIESHDTDYVISYLREFHRILSPDGTLCLTYPLEMYKYLEKDFKLRYWGVWEKSNFVRSFASTKKPPKKTELYIVVVPKEANNSNIVFNKVYYEAIPYERKHRKRKDLTQSNSELEVSRKDSLRKASTQNWTQEGYDSINDGFRISTDIIQAPNKPCMKYHERTIHPTQKPIHLFEVLMLRHSNINDMIVDPFVGSGTTAVVAKRNQRQFMVNDYYYEFFDITNDRINKTEIVSHETDKDGNIVFKKPYNQKSQKSILKKNQNNNEQLNFF